MMTVDSATSFVTQNGAFGVLVLLVGAFCWWGLPYLARQQEKFEARMDAKDAAHKAEIADLTARFAATVDRNTVVIGELRTDIQTNTRATESLAARVGQLERVLDARRP